MRSRQDESHAIATGRILLVCQGASHLLGALGKLVEGHLPQGQGRRQHLPHTLQHALQDVWSYDSCAAGVQE
jgi:hypothetical protein